MKKIGLVLAVWCAALGVRAQMEHEVLLLVNKQSQASLKVANTYIEARHIPRRNVVYLDIPERVYGGTATISPEDFTKLIWEPANAVMKERKLDQQIAAWIYSVDFPIRVETSKNDRKQMSVGGLTFLRNKIPDLETVEKGTYLSTLFGGGNAELKQELVSMSFGTQRDGLDGLMEVTDDELAYLKKGLGGEMPLPNMMLGYVGENGNDVDTVLETIQRGVKSDYRGLHRGIYFVQNDDVRSTCRDWQFYPAENALKQRGIAATVTDQFPEGVENVMGVLTGAATVEPSKIKSFAAGAMAEHLTSWGAEFQKPQTKLTEWLKAGATASAGTVVEPYSTPNKFPAARFFVHYTSGCTMIESFYQSIACPLQTLLLGDPLAKPYAVRMRIGLVGVNELSSSFTYVGRAQAEMPNVKLLYSFYMDGKEVRAASEEASYYLRADALSDGYHTMRMVAYTHFPVRFSGVVEKEILVNRKGRGIAFRQSINDMGNHQYGFKVDIAGTQMPQEIKLVCGERVLAEQEFDPEAELVLDETVIGEGPNHLQLVAVYADGMQVRSKPAFFTVVFSKE